MTTAQLDSFYRSILDIEGFASTDSSLNGLQVDNDGTEVKKVAFAVDASLESFKRAAAAGAGMLFVHHGLFWAKPLRVSGIFRQRVKFLLDNNIALYAAHLPLDQHPAVGNNAVLGTLLGIENPEPFGFHHGRAIGIQGKLKTPLTVQEAAHCIEFCSRSALAVYPFGEKINRTAAVISGGASELAVEAIEQGIDLFVTGESSHSYYHHALEGRLNVVAGGHYNTEVWGVRSLMDLTAQKLSLDVAFIDVPTGL
ncbi:GTP cyclohydrolase 1 type 2 [Spirochaetia bacterium]|nr:GTP cyclohydrolase 1 type 2 [Spirochaetia bacterium]GHU31494.1 GTP cyclohydrolase 1 type 2 [Spirochaetia bacterium]